MSGPYLAWRIKDMRRKPPVMSGSANPYRQGACSNCQEPVWFHPEHCGDRRLLCWPCEQTA